MSLVNDSVEESSPLIHSSDDIDVVINPDGDQMDKKDNSVSVVFSLWSTMIGSTLLAMPKTFREAGVFPGIPGMALMCAVMCYTGIIMVRCGSYYGRTTLQILASHHPAMRVSSILVSVVIFLGAMCLYHVYLTQSILAFAKIDMSDDKWRIIVTLCVTAFVFLVGALKSLTPIFKASSYCIIVIVFIIIFIIVKSAFQLANDDCPKKLEQKVGLGFNGVGNIAVLLSTLGVALFCQNIMLSILTQATRPSKTPRNCVIAWICVSLSYGIPSVIATIAFAPCADFKGDFIEMFDDPFTDVARVAIMLLVGVVYPLLLFAGRQQILSFRWEEGKNPYIAHIGNNCVMLAITSIPSLINMSVVLVAALVGLFGLYWGICIPTISYIRARREQGTATVPFLVAHGALLAFAVCLICITVLSVVGVIETGDHGTIVSPPSIPVPTNHSNNLTQWLWAAPV